MQKKLFWLVSFLAFGVMSGCGSGSSSSSSDTQTGSVNITSGTSTFTMTSYTATGCATIAANGSCTLQLSGYTGNGIYAGTVTVALPSGYTLNNQTCNNASMLANSCSLTLYNTNSSSVTSAQSFYITANGNNVTSALTIGGGNY